MSAIKAEYITLKHLKTKDTYQIVLEVPAESIEHVTQTLGFPKTHGSKWVGVALLNPETTILDAG